jgi:hypothetical protein
MVSLESKIELERVADHVGGHDRIVGVLRMPVIEPVSAAAVKGLVDPSRVTPVSTATVVGADPHGTGTRREAVQLAQQLRDHQPAAAWRRRSWSGSR